MTTRYELYIFSEQQRTVEWLQETFNITFQNTPVFLFRLKKQNGRRLVENIQKITEGFNRMFRNNSFDFVMSMLCVAEIQWQEKVCEAFGISWFSDTLGLVLLYQEVSAHSKWHQEHN